MANSTHPVPTILGPGAGAIKLRGLASNQSPHVWCPEAWWHQRITGKDLRELGAQVVTANMGAAPSVDGVVRTTFTGGGLVSAVAIDSVVGSADAAGDIAATIAANITTEIAGDLAGVIASAAEDGSDIGITGEVGIAEFTVTFEWIPDVQTFDATFVVATGGDGNYDIVFTHPDLTDPVVSRVVRAGGSPATDTNMADAMESEIEADPRLNALVANADNAAGVNTITTFAGVSGLDVVEDGTFVAGGLVVDETTPTMDITQVTNWSASIVINTAFPQNAIWGEVDLGWVGIYRNDESAANGLLSSITSNEAATILSSVALDDTGWVGQGAGAVDDRQYAALDLTVIVIANFDYDEWFEIWAVLRKHQTGAW
jgi:hypothetical protein